MRFRWQLLCAVLSSVLGVAPSFANEWAQSFDPPMLATYLDSPRSYVIISAGYSHSEARKAAGAFESALRKTGKAKNLRSDDSPTRFKGMTDEEIVAKCARLPVDAIAIVRILPSAVVGKPPDVLVTLYDKSAQVLSAIAVEAGAKLAPRAGSPEAKALEQASKPAPVEAPEPAPLTSVAAKPAPAPALVAPALPATPAATPPAAASAAAAAPPAPAPELKVTVTKAEPTPPSPAELAYEGKRIWYENPVPAGAKEIERTPAFVGQDYEKETLDGSDFYWRVNKPELARSYRNWVVAKSVLAVTGLLATVGGSAAAFYGLVAACKRSDHTGVCLERDPRYAQYGLATAGGGLLFVVGAAFIGPHPVEAIEARKLADDYNHQLRKDLKLPPLPAAPPPAKQAARPRDLRWGALVSRDTFGVGLSGEL